MYTSQENKKNSTKNAKSIPDTVSCISCTNFKIYWHINMLHVHKFPEMYEKKHLMCINNYFPVIFTSYQNACTAIKLLFHVCGHQRETRRTKARMHVHLLVQQHTKICKSYWCPWLVYNCVCIGINNFLQVYNNVITMFHLL